MRPADGGFTLLELLVALTIVGLGLTMAPAAVSRGRASMEIQTAARQLAQDLRAAQRTAVNDGRTVEVVVDVGRRRLHSSVGTMDRSYSNVTSIAFEAPETGAAQGIRFFPDGSTSGGTIRLSLGETSRAVTVLMLSGRVRHD